MKSLGSEDIYEPESTASEYLTPIDAVQQLFKGTGGKSGDGVFLSTLFLCFYFF